jgi:hypothetical protein
MAALIDGVPPGHTRILADTNILIEAKRVGAWNALSDRFRIVTTSSCVSEAKAGSDEMGGYIALTDADLARLDYVHEVTPLEFARYKLAAPDISIDRGEEELLAYAHSLVLRGDTVWVLSTADRAAINAALSIGLAEHLVSLSAALKEISHRPKPELRDHYGSRYLSVAVTEFLLG